jgi:hypothetical protein
MTEREDREAAERRWDEAEEICRRLFDGDLIAVTPPTFARQRRYYSSGDAHGFSSWVWCGEDSGNSGSVVRGYWIS